MDSALLYRLAADSILLIHTLFVGFVVIGLVMIVLGGLLHWQWVRNTWFRILHLIAIGIVVIQAWVGMICPLTQWEMMFRAKAGEAVYPGSFISHWLENLLYYQAPIWVFIVVYTLFGAIVVACWFWVRPRPMGSHHPVVDFTPE